MRSFLILEVTHGESTDVVDALINGMIMDAHSMHAGGHECRVGYAVAIDVPAHTPTAAEVAGILST